MLSVIYSTRDAIPIMTLSGRFDDLGVWIFDEKREDPSPVNCPRYSSWQKRRLSSGK